MKDNKDYKLKIKPSNSSLESISKYSLNKYLDKSLNRSRESINFTSLDAKLSENKGKRFMFDEMMFAGMPPSPVQEDEENSSNDLHSIEPVSVKQSSQEEIREEPPQPSTFS